MEVPSNLREPEPEQNVELDGAVSRRDMVEKIKKQQKDRTLSQSSWRSC